MARRMSDMKDPFRSDMLDLQARYDVEEGDLESRDITELAFRLLIEIDKEIQKLKEGK